MFPDHNNGVWSWQKFWHFLGWAYPEYSYKKYNILFVCVVLEMALFVFWGTTWDIFYDIKVSKTHEIFYVVLMWKNDQQVKYTIYVYQSHMLVNQMTPDLNFVRICWKNTLTYLFFMIISNKKRLKSSFIAELSRWRVPYLQLSGCVNSNWNVEVARGALMRHQFLSYLFSMTGSHLSPSGDKNCDDVTFTSNDDELFQILRW